MAFRALEISKDTDIHIKNKHSQYDDYMKTRGFIDYFKSVFFMSTFILQLQ